LAGAAAAFGKAADFKREERRLSTNVSMERKTSRSCNLLFLHRVGVAISGGLNLGVLDGLSLTTSSTGTAVARQCLRTHATVLTMIRTHEVSAATAFG